MNPGHRKPDETDVEIDRRPDEDRPMAWRLLRAGVPLSLLLDLAAPNGPDSERIAALERMAHG